jgi:hypothetical protein
MKTLVLTPNNWRSIRDVLHQEQPRSVLALRNKMKDVLGFTIREHRVWVEGKVDPVHITDGIIIDERYGQYVDQVHLDFYDERKRDFFLLRFSEHLNKQV